MNKFFTCLLLLTYFLVNSQDQKLPYVNYTDIQPQLDSLKTENNYAKMIAMLDQVHPADSLYCKAQSLKSYYLVLDEQLDKVIKEVKPKLNLYCQNEHKAKLYLNLSFAHSKQDEYKQSEQVLEQGIKEFPKNSSLHYNKGFVYYKSEQYESAISSFQQSIKYKPTLSDAHYNLGRISYEQGQSALALSAYLMSVFSSPESESSLRKLAIIEEKFSEKNKNASQIQVDPAQNLTNKTDLILDNLIALEDNYEVDHDIPITTVKQAYILFDQLDDLRKTDGFWNDTYFNFFEWIKRNDYVEPFLYTILLSTTNDEYKKILDKKIKSIKRFAKEAYPIWYSIMQLTNTEIDSPDDKKAYYYYDNSKVSSQGLTKNKNPIGQWELYDDFGAVSSTGYFDENSERTGTWKWFDEFGNLKELNDLKDGESNGIIALYHPNGNTKLSYYQKDNKAYGEYKYFTYYGGLKILRNIEDGKLNGNFTEYFDTGKSNIEYEGKFLDGDIHGEFVEYYSDGKIFSKSTFDKGEKTDLEYHFNFFGDTIYKANFQDDNLNGDVITYYANGQVKEKGSAKDNKYTGKWESFAENGDLKLSYTLKDGDYNGNYQEFYDGKKYIEYTYDMDKLLGYIYYDQSGKIVDSKTSKNGIRDFTGYYPHGQLMLEGKYDDNGKKSGLWKQYYRNGNLKEKNTYKDGKSIGESITYFKSGQKKVISHYNDNNEMHGAYKSFYRNGQLKTNGNLKNGDQHGYWVGYQIDGDLNYEIYFHKGKYNGKKRFYGAEGELTLIETFYYDHIINEIYYDQDKKIYDKIEHLKDSAQYTLNYNSPKGKKQVIVEYGNGLKNGSYKLFEDEGNMITKGNYVVGKQHGKWFYYYSNGELESEVNYIYDNKHGEVKEFDDDGNLEALKNYEYGDRSGKWTYFYDDETVKSTKNYKDDLYDGRFEYFDQSGELQIVYFYDQGYLEAYTYLDENGEEKAPIAITNKKTTIKSYYQNGNLAVQVTLKDNLYNGKLIKYHPNGDKYIEANYSGGYKNGIYKDYHDNGELASESNYVYGYLQGKLIDYYDNGQIKKSTTYKNDIKSGTQIEYLKNGKEKDKQEFFDGDKI